MAQTDVVRLLRWALEADFFEGDGFESGKFFGDVRVFPEPEIEFGGINKTGIGAGYEAVCQIPVASCRGGAVDEQIVVRAIASRLAFEIHEIF